MARKHSFTTKGGKPDPYRAANLLLRDLLNGKKVRLSFLPPGATVEDAEQAADRADPQVSEV